MLVLLFLASQVLVSHVQLVLLFDQVLQLFLEGHLGLLD
jgi:hypothetical protein